MTVPATTKPKTGTLPKGTYDAQITSVTPIRRKEDRSWVLLINVRTTRLKRDGTVWQGLATEGDDPYALDDRQLERLRRFAERLGIRSAQTAEDIVEDLLAIAEAGEVVQCKVAHTPVGQQVTIFKETVVLPAISEPSEEDAQAAHEAHEKFIGGLGEVRAGLMHAAEGAYELRAIKGWKALGEDTLNAYLARPEVTYSRSEFYRLADIWESYVLEGGLDAALLEGASDSLLEVPLPALSAGVVSAEQALADAVSMPRADLRSHYQGLLGNDDDQAGGGEGEPDEAPEPDPAGETTYLDPARFSEAIDAIGGLVAAHGGECDWALDVVKDAMAVHAVNGSANPPRVVIPEAAHTVTVTLRRVLDEVGRPEQKRMSKELRQAVVDALTQAEEHGLGALGAA